MKRALLFLISILLIPEFSDFSQPTLAQWQKQTSGTTEHLNDVDVLNQTTAVVIGNKGTILKTTDSGLNWIQKNSNTTNNLNAVSFRNEENGIVVGNEVLCRTTDGGESWSATTFSDNFISVAYRNQYSTGLPIIIGGDNGKIVYSNNDGSSWSDTLFFPGWPVIAVGFNYYSPSLLYPIAYAANTGWTTVNYSFPSSEWNLYENPVTPVWDILTGGEFYDLSQYLVGAYGNPGPIPVLLRRTDSDTTWEYMFAFVSGPYVPEDITSINEILFVCGSTGRIFNSKDGGDSWIEQFTGTAEDLLAISFWNNSIGYSVGNNGTILFTSNGGVSDVDEEEEKPVGYYLTQNYPNPFNPTTNIEFRIVEFGFVSLKVFDVLGNEVATLVNEEKPAGEYKVEFEVGANRQFVLTSGVYFYQLTTENYIETKKMILAK